MTRELQDQLNKIYAKAIDPKTSDNYASALKRKARLLCRAASVPREKWPPWAEEGAAWQDRADRTQEVRYPPALPDAVVEVLEEFRAKNNPAEARALCRHLGIEPPPWARR